jgi:hypothetical protein
MVGVLHGFGGEYGAIRTIRDDVLNCLFGKSADGLRKLIDHSLSSFQAAARASGEIESLGVAIAGIHAGPLRATAAASASDLLKTACLLYSSLGSLDKLDEQDETDAPQQEEVNRRFGSEVKSIVLNRRPDLVRYFGKSGCLIAGGQPVKFGFFSEKAVIHFTVLHSVRWSASLKDARSRLWELQRAREISGVSSAVLIAAVPREDDATLGDRQREQLIKNKLEIEREADSVNMRWYAVTTASEGAGRVIEVAA